MTDSPQDSHLTTQQLQAIELVTKLESIFMPYATRQRDKAYRSNKTGHESFRCVHYTSADAALKIINTKRFWMRNSTCMADYREVQHGYDLLIGFFSKQINRDAFVSTIDKCAPGLAMEVLKRFDSQRTNITLGTFITSISEHDDSEDASGRLSMWRAFGESARVALVFRIPRLSAGALALNLLFSPVAYLAQAAAESVIGEAIENVKENVDFLRSVSRAALGEVLFNMLLAAVTCLKHEGFREEREWRAIYAPEVYPSAVIKPSTETIRGVPQRVYQLPLDAAAYPALTDLDFSRIFDRLIIGPSQYPWAMFEAFGHALREAGVPNAPEKICNSLIPIRA